MTLLLLLLTATLDIEGGEAGDIITMDEGSNIIFYSPAPEGTKDEKPGGVWLGDCGIVFWEDEKRCALVCGYKEFMEFKPCDPYKESP
jgi:hypothetical protein